MQRPLAVGQPPWRVDSARSASKMWSR
jgi:hypothetical protein